MKTLITLSLLSLAFNLQAQAEQLPRQCVEVAVKAAESAYNNLDMWCFGSAEVVRARMEGQNSARVELAVSNYGPNVIDCTSQLFEVKVTDVNGVCKAVQTKLLGNINI